MKNVSLKTAAMLVALLSATAPFTARAQGGEDAKSQLTPTLRYINVSDNVAKFREDRWIKQDITGGIEDMWLRHDLGGDVGMTLSGRAIFDEGDYRLLLDVVKPDTGFLRAGFTQYRKYFNDNGGFFPRFSTKSFSLGRDLDLDIGNYFVEVGLTLPDLPKVTLGYERMYKDGQKSSLRWGSVTDNITIPPYPVGSRPSGTISRSIHPAYKMIDERVDIFKVDVEHSIENVNLGNFFRYEQYNNNVSVVEKRTLNLATAPNIINANVMTKERFDYDSLANTFIIDSHINEKVYLSGGYMFVKLDGEPNYSMDTQQRLNPATGSMTYASRDKFWFNDFVKIDQKSHVLNLNGAFGPFGGLSLYGGLQLEKTDTDTKMDGDDREVFSGTTVQFRDLKVDVHNQKDSIEGTAGLRFTNIPWTTVYAEGKWAQQNIDLFEHEILGAVGAPANLSVASEERLTATDISRNTYSVGFNTAPLQRMTLMGRYRRTENTNTYDHLIDGFDGYSAFINRQAFTTNDYLVSMTVRPTSQLSVAFRYNYVESDTETAHGATTSGSITAGSLQAGSYKAQKYSLQLTLTPVTHMYVTGMFSYQPTRTVSFTNDSNTVIPFEGDVYSIFLMSGIAIDKDTDLTVEYSFDTARNFVNNAFSDAPPTGFGNNDYTVPYRIDYDRHGLKIGVSRRINDYMVAQLGYGLYNYREPTNGGIDNYTAHMIAGQCTVRF